MSTTSTPAYKVLGTRPIRHDGVDKVTGRARYGADIHVPGMLHGAILRSPHAHARIVWIDTTKAATLPGVKAVVTSRDLPDPLDKIAELGEGAVNLKYLSSNVLARGKALYKGHAIAAVAATDPHVAEQALKLIDVAYEPLPPVLDVLAAMQPDAPLLHEDLRTESLAAPADRPSNVARRIEFSKGDPAKGFAEADIIIEREFRTATVHQGYIEPHTSTALWNADGHITIWTATQGAFTVREQVAELLDLPVSRVTVAPMEIGGGFGGKISVYEQPVAAVLSRLSGRPVKITMSRAEVLEGTGPTPASYSRVKIGATRDGRITAATAWMAFEAGAFPGSPIGAACMTVFACYDVPHGRVDGFDVLVNKPQTKAYRAPGATQAAFAVETVIDELCTSLGIDPLEFRLKNAAVEGTRRLDGPAFPRIGMRETVEAAIAHPHYRAPLGPSPSPLGPPAPLSRPSPLSPSAPAPRAGEGRPSSPSPLAGEGRPSSPSPLAGEGWGGGERERRRDTETPRGGEGRGATHHSPLTVSPTRSLAHSPTRLRGRGVASGFWFNAGLKSSCTAAVNPDGTVSLIEGSTDIGGTRTSIAMQLAETLGIPAEDVLPQVADTDSVGYNDVTGGSRVTFASGWAAIEAARDIQRQMVARAAMLWQVDPREVVARDGCYVLKSKDASPTRPLAHAPTRRITFKDLAAKLSETGGPVVGRAAVEPKGVGGAFATHIVDVEVDPETGHVQILRYTAVQDAGKAVHPSYVEGQMQGGVAQGIGWALNEEYFYNERGEMANASLLDYRMPTALDLPMIDTLIVEVPNPGHPYGVRGVGEVPIVPPPAAIANAIHAAVGVRLRELPMNPGRVLETILASERVSK